MSEISGANLITLSDSIAKQKQLIDAIVGAEATADTVLYGMQLNVDRIATYGEDAIADMSKQFVSEKSQMPSYILDINHNAIQSVDGHLRRLTGLSIGEYWEQENYPSNRIAPEFAQIGRAIGQFFEPYLVWSPIITPMATFLVTGTGAGTFTDGNYIDGNLYAPADLECKITAVGGASVTLLATIIGTDENGAVVTGTCDIVAQALNAVIDIVPDQADKQFMDITNVTITSGATDDAFIVQSKVDRALSL